MIKKYRISSIKKGDCIYMLVRGKFVLKTTVASILSVLSVMSANAYQQGEGVIATIEKGESVTKQENVTAESLGSVVSGSLNRAGNPVRIIWYGNENDADGKVPQTGLLNDGFIQGKVRAVGQNTTEKEEYAGSVVIEGQGNAVDALGWTAHTNPNDVVYALEQLTNTRLVQGEAELIGGQAKLYGNVKSFASGNGVSVVGAVDFGKGYSGVDGMSGATNSASSPTGLIYREQRGVEESDSQIEFLANPKNVDVSVTSVDNQGKISGKVIAQGATSPNGQDRDTEETPLYAVKTASSANAISVSSYVFTPSNPGWTGPDSSTYKNYASLKKVNNTGLLSAEAQLSGGIHAKDTYTVAKAVANGISVAALSNNEVVSSTGGSTGYATHKTQALLSEGVNNQGRIKSTLHQTSGDNSLVKIGAYSIAEAIASGNAVSVYAESTSSKTKENKATIGTIQNNGEMTAKAFVYAGNGAGDLSVKVKGVGNGISAYSSAYSSKGNASIGNITNAGVISGFVETKPGVSALGTNKDIPVEAVKIAVANSSNKGNYPKHLPTTPNSSTEGSGITRSYRADNEVFASGNGISAFTGESSRNNEGATLGNIDNTGVISGFANMYHGFKSGGSYSSKGYQPVRFTAVGSGIAVDNKITNDIINAGIISGNHAAVIAKGDAGFSRNSPNYAKTSYEGKLENYGLMAGAMIEGHYHYNEDYSTMSDGMGQPYRYYESDQRVLKNAGTLVYLKKGLSGTQRSTVRDEDAGKIERIVVGDARSYTAKDGQVYSVINAEVNTEGTDSNHRLTQQALSNTIVNGVGLAEGALLVEQDASLTNIVVNGFKTALKLASDVTVNVQKSTFNSNGFLVNLDQKPLAISGDSGKNQLILSQHSVVNGDIHLYDGDDALTIGDASVKMNGAELNFGAGNNTLRLGQQATTSNDSIKIDYRLVNATNIDVNQGSRLTADARVQGTDTIALNDELVYEVNGDKDHALYSDTRQDNLLLRGNGLFTLDISKDLYGNPAERVVDFGTFDLVAENTVRYATSNVFQKVRLENGNLIISVKEAQLPPTSVIDTMFVTPYIDAYNSFVDSWKQGNANFLANSASTKDKTEAQASRTVNDYLGKVVNETIYGALPSMATNTLQAFNQASVGTYAKRLNTGELDVYASVGGGLYRYQDIVKSGHNTQALIGMNYGVSNRLSLGGSVGISHHRLDGYQGSYLKGNTGLINVHAILGWDKLSWRSGVAYGKMHLNGMRHISNGYDSHSFKVKLKPTVASIFTELKYALPMSDSLSVEPKLGLSYNMVKIDRMQEQGAGALTLNNRNYKTFDVAVGSDIVLHKALMSGGVLSSKLSVDYVHTTGAHKLSASFIGGNDFAINTLNNRNAVRVGLGLEYEQKGFFVRAGVANNFQKLGSALTAQLGLGIRF